MTCRSTPNMTEQRRRGTPSRCALWIWIGLCATHCVLLALAALSPVLDATWLEGFGMTVLAIPYLLHQLGLPVLQDGGMSGWGMALPNVLGWLVSAAAWIAFYGVTAAAIQRIARR